MAPRKKDERTPLSEYTKWEIQLEAEERGILDDSYALSDYSDEELLFELDTRNVAPSIKDYSSDELIEALLRRPDVNSKQTGLSVKLSIQIGGRPVTDTYGPTTVIWKRD